MDEEDEIPDWQREDEKIPPSLERKWEKENFQGPEKEETELICRSCGNPVRRNVILCLYCGEPTGIKVGLFGHLRAFLLENILGFILFLAILGVVAILFVI